VTCQNGQNKFEKQFSAVRKNCMSEQTTFTKTHRYGFILKEFFKQDSNGSIVHPPAGANQSDSTRSGNTGKSASSTSNTTKNTTKPTSSGPSTSVTQSGSNTGNISSNGVSDAKGTSSDTEEKYDSDESEDPLIYWDRERKCYIDDDGVCYNSKGEIIPDPKRPGKLPAQTVKSSSAKTVKNKSAKTTKNPADKEGFSSTQLKQATANSLRDRFGNQSPIGTGGSSASGYN